jgi:threonine synthase
LYLSALTGFHEIRTVQAQPTLASAIQIGNPVSMQKAIRTLQTFDGVVEQASEDELANAVARADRTGLFNCPHTGVALAVLFKLAQRGVIAPQDRVVVISTANGLKFPEFKIKYHESQLPDITSHYANLPVDLPADYTCVRDAIFRALDQRVL